jgi:ubiquitin carboxyl-terminal hydrolase 10
VTKKMTRLQKINGISQILQVLLFCVPFYDFLDQASKKASYSFGKSEIPLIDGM